MMSPGFGQNGFGMSVNQIIALETEIVNQNSHHLANLDSQMGTSRPFWIGSHLKCKELKTISTGMFDPNMVQIH